MVIYQIKINNKVYIGSTSNFLRRKRQHTTELNCNTHPNSKLQNAYNKYKIFEITIVEEAISPDTLLEREQYYLDLFKPFYNIRKVVENNRGCKWKQKFSTKKYKPTQQFDKEGNLIKEYSSVKEAASSIGANETNISACCNGWIKSCKGFVFKFKNNFIPYKYTNRLTPQEASKLNGLKSAKTFKITYKNGKEEIFTNLSEWCRQNNINRRSASDYLKKDTMARLGYTLNETTST